MNRQTKKRAKPIKTTPDQERMIEELADKGIPDGEIAQLTGANLSVVQIRVTRYWQRKMNRAHNFNTHI